MSAEIAFIDALRAIATDPAARGLADDAAVLAPAQGQTVLTMDTIVEGVHFLPDDPPETVAWKLMAVNASDLSAKGATPIGCLTSHALGDPAWDARFADGLGIAARHFAMPVLGGDTVRMPPGSARSFSLTALGNVAPGGPVPSRAGARPGHGLWVSGTLGDAGLWLAHRLRRAGYDQTPFSALPQALCEAYRRPSPDARLGPALAPHVSAMMDVSDGLLVDAARMARASGAALSIDIDAVPLSTAFRGIVGDSVRARTFAATAGDDYVLLLAAPQANAPELRVAADRLGQRLTRIGTFDEGEGLLLLSGAQPIPLPASLGYQH